MTEILKSRFQEVISDEQELRQFYNPIVKAAETKIIDRLDIHCRRFIEKSPFVIVASTKENGQLDLSPKGDGPGFIHILDDNTLLIPDRMGNNRLDTFSNLLKNPAIGIFVLVPERGETLRIHGRAILLRDESIRQSMALGDRVPELIIAVAIEQVYFHCARCISRSGLWDNETWLDVDDLVNLGSVLNDHAAIHLTKRDSEK